MWERKKFNVDLMGQRLEKSLRGHHEAEVNSLGKRTKENVFQPLRRLRKPVHKRVRGVCLS